MPRVEPGSIRLRIGLGVALALAATLGGLFLVLDSAVDGELYQRFEAGLARRANGIVAYLGGSSAPLPPIERWMPEFREQGHRDFFQAWDDHGRVLARSDSAGRIDLPRPPSPARDDYQFYDLVLPDGHRGRAVARRYPLADGDPRGGIVLVLAEEREQIDALERRLHLLLSVVVLAGMGLGLLLVLRGTRVALRPLDELVRRIAAVSPTGPRTPLGAMALPRELAPVAQRFDAIIDTLLGTLERERRFAQNLAHELRTPVAELRAITETSLLIDDAGRQRESLQELARLGREMEQTVEALLALARHEAGLVQAQAEPLDLAATVRAACRRARTQANGAALDCTLELPDEWWALADASMCQQLLAVLLNNAFEHAPAGSRLRIVAEPAQARLWIENAAPDLDAADLEQLGTRFFRPSRQARRDERAHAGLGLALAHALVAALGLDMQLQLVDGRLRVSLSGWTALAGDPA